MTLTNTGFEATMSNSEQPNDDFFNDLSQDVPIEDSAEPQSGKAHRKGSDTAGENEGNSKAKRIACVLCRKRKLRCDGARPTCGTCKRLTHECAYDEVRKKSGPKRGYVKQLEARLRRHIPGATEQDSNS